MNEVLEKLIELIKDSFSNSLDQKAMLIKKEFDLEIQRIATSAYNAGVADGIKKEADRCAKPIVREFFDVSGDMKTKPGIHGKLYSVDGLLWYSTPQTAQASYERQSK